MTTPPPGWYSDPQTVRLIRWWDGERWTTHTHLATSSGPPAAVVIQQETPQPAGETTRGAMVTAAQIAVGLVVLYLGLVACDRLALDTTQASGDAEVSVESSETRGNNPSLTFP